MENREINGEALRPFYGYTWEEYLLATDSEQAYRSGGGYWTVSRAEHRMDEPGTQRLITVGSYLSLSDALTAAQIDRKSCLESLLPRPEIKWCMEGEHRHIKFDDCVTEALWLLSLDDSHNAETGSIEWNHWFALFTDMGDMEPHKVEHGWITIPDGSYLLYANDRGFVGSHHFVSADDARKEFDRIADKYAAWSEENES